MLTRIDFQSVLSIVVLVATVGCSNEGNNLQTSNTSRGEEDPIAILERGQWGWIETENVKSLTCRDNPHEIRFSEDKREVNLLWEKPFEGADGFNRHAIYKVVKIKTNSIEMNLVGETRKDSLGNLVTWELILDNEKSYSWRRSDWDPHLRTPVIEKCEDS